MSKKTLTDKPGAAAQEDLKTTAAGHSSIAEYACTSVAPEHWREPLGGESPVLHLPTDHPRPAIPTPGSGQHRLMLPKHLVDDFKVLSREEGSTLFVALLAAFKTLLYRYTGQTEIVVGTSVMGCALGDLEGLVGRVANLLPLRTTLSGDLSFKELLGRVHQAYENGRARRDVPFELSAEKLPPEHKSSGASLLSVMFDMYREPRAAPNRPGLSMQNIEAEPQFTNFEVALTIEETGHGLEAIFVYRRELFEAETIRRMAAHYRKLIEEMCDKPDAHLGELPLLGQEERHQLLYEWNETQREFPTQKCLHELFEEQVERAPEATAVVCGNQRLSYAELHALSNRVARYLESRGVGAEARVGVWMERGVEMVAAVLGVLKAGAAYLPIEPGAPVERVQYMLEDAEARVLLTHQRLAALRVLHGVEVVCPDTDAEALARQSDQPLHNRVTLDNLAYVIYTSGSTGKPKGVPNTHRGLLNLALWYRETFHVTAEDRTTQLVRVAFDAVMLELWPYLSAGASIHFPDEETRLSPQALRDWLIAQHITISFLPTPLAEKMMFLEWPTKLSLRLMLTGGDRLHMPPPTNLPFTVVNNYGPSESSVIATSAAIAPVNQSTTLPPIGRAVSNVQAYVLDSYLQPVPMNVVGELYVGGAGLGRGYLRRPALTAECFIPHPYSSEAGARLYRTGDLVRYLPDGNLDFVGRADHQVKIRGYRIELGEIESVLNSHPSVCESAVMARNGALGDKQLVAYVAIDKTLEVTTARLQNFLKEQLPDYMVPGAFVFLNELPLSPNGKVDRRALPVPEQTHSTSSENYVAPRSPDERQLAEIWSEVLKVERVGVNDNFFELGGHSLLAAQVSSRARNIFKVDLPLYIFLQASTVAELADAVSQQRAAMAEGEILLSTLPEIVHDPENSFEPFPLSDVQQAYWLGRSGAFEFGNVTSHIYFEFESRGLDLQRLNAAWQRLILRHPMLRAIVRDDGLQQILPHTPP
ncbi:MAG TPA: amino acid adenylation domain-containing protein, partial [Pyrinomonadaceae bacterium]|nr:amino acid adenylation domain-containing protein [Pyrinomonadaceae bacterium]